MTCDEAEPLFNARMDEADPIQRALFDSRVEASSSRATVIEKLKSARYAIRGEMSAHFQRNGYYSKHAGGNFLPRCRSIHA